MKKWKANVSNWCARADDSSIRHAMVTLAESEAQEGNPTLGVEIWETIIEDAKENKEWMLVSHMLTHGNKILEIAPDKKAGDAYIKKHLESMKKGP
tara:strand:+ start:3313 stop:3600 length:288 start_codon:yes stop_codon:yes gene_type:complete